MDVVSVNRFSVGTFSFLRSSISVLTKPIDMPCCFYTSQGKKVKWAICCQIIVACIEDVRNRNVGSVIGQLSSIIFSLICPLRSLTAGLIFAKGCFKLT